MAELIRTGVIAPANPTGSNPPGLVDAHGRPLVRAELTEEVAGPSISGVRSISSPHPAQGLDPQKLAGILRRAETGDAGDYLALAEELEEKDLHYLSVLGTRKRAVSQLPIEVEAAGEDAECEADAQFVRDWLKRDTLEPELFDILDAIGKGYSNTEIVWKTKPRLWLPEKLKWRDPRWFEFDQLDGETMYLKGDDGAPRRLSAFKYISHVHPAKSGLPIRGGLARAVAWFYLIKNFSIKDWVVFMDAYGMPLRVGKYENGTSADHIRILQRALAMLGSDAAAAIPKSMEVEFIDRKAGETGDLFHKLAAYADEQISKAVLGQTSSSDAKSGGLGSGQADLHNDVRGDIERSDAVLLAATLNRDLVQPMIMLNRGERTAYPRLRIGRPEAIDVTGLSEALVKLVPLGLKVGMAEVRRRIGMPEPKGDEELLAAPSPAPPPAPPTALDGPGGAAKPRLAFLGPLKPRGGAVRNGDEDAEATALAELAEVGDEIDVAAAGAIADWGTLMEPIVGPIERLVADASSLEDLRERLASAMAEIDPAELTERLARAQFAARLAGDADTLVEDG